MKQQRKTVQKPDSTRLHVLGVNVAPADKPKHRQPRRIVWATVTNSGKVYPYNSRKRNGPYHTDGRTIVVNPEAYV